MTGDGLMALEPLICSPKRHNINADLSCEFRSQG